MNPLGWLISKGKTITNAIYCIEKLKLLNIAIRPLKSYGHFGKQFGNSAKTIIIQLTQNAGILLLCKHSSK